jgi:hypothetical protein
MFENYKKKKWVKYNQWTLKNKKVTNLNNTNCDDTKWTGEIQIK